MKDGSEEDIYSALMMAVARTGPKAKNNYDEIRASMRYIIAYGAQMPQKNEITTALSHVTAIAKKEIKEEPPLEWVKNDDELVITDQNLFFI